MIGDRVFTLKNLPISIPSSNAWWLRIFLLTDSYLESI
jgi:hypothetical protein